MAVKPRTEWLIYGAIAFLGIMPALQHPGSVVGEGADAFGTWWFYDWIRRCVENGWNPSWTPDFYYPLGKGIFAHTGNNFVDAVLSVPFQWIFGPYFYFPIFIWVLQVGNAAMFRPLARHVLGEEGVFPATLLYTTSPFVIFELTAGRPTQAMVWFFPAAALYLLKLIENPGWRPALGLGLAVAVSGWTYWFSLYALVFLLTPLLLVQLRKATDPRKTLLWIGGAALLCLAMILPAVQGMSAEVKAKTVPGMTVTNAWFSLPEALSNNVNPDLHGLVLLETYGTSVISTPVVLLILAFSLWKRPLKGQGWLLAAAVVVLFAIGPVLRLGSGDAIPLPWYLILYNKAPFFQRLWFPYRLVGAAFVPIALLGGALLLQRPKWLSMLAGVGMLAGQIWWKNWPLAWHDGRPPPMLQTLEPAGVLFLPMRVQHDGLMWQTWMKMPTFGGMGESASVFWPEGYERWLKDPFLRALREASLKPEKAQGTAMEAPAWLLRLGYRWVLYRQDVALFEQSKLAGSAPDLRRVAWGVDSLSRVLGPPDGVDGPVVLWDLKHEGSLDPNYHATPERLKSPAWVEAAAPSFQRHIEEAEKQGRPMR
ncbi:MAG TPA: hypothetical protein PLA94_12755 [Myxococcota bacterium]|nr:hypothetical protein [Myxococcota bacterium]